MRSPLRSPMATPPTRPPRAGAGPRRLAATLLGIVALLAAAPRPAAAVGYVETPSLAARVASGALPPVAQRLPAHPRVIRLTGPGLEPGRPGGTLRLLMGREKDVRMMSVYGYARLVVYDRHYRIIPDILESVDVEQGRRFTFHLRKGHRWSDGYPFTAEDFRFYWDDVVLNHDLTPFGAPPALVVDGETGHFSVIDDTTVRYEWSKPNPYFLPALAGARPEFLYAPAHYLERFHKKYADPAKLAALVKAAGQRNWVGVFVHHFRPYHNTNPDLPTLEPWVVRTAPPTQRFVFERNPYFHRVDANGHQLPYIDRVVMNIADAKLVPAKTGAGESDLQARNLSFSDYTFLKQSEKRVGQRVLLWRTTKGSHVALFPNLNVKDPVWRALVRDVRFRRALSLAIDRDEINQVMYFGLARPANDTVDPSSPLYRQEYEHRWAEFDLAKANALLDQIGLAKRNSDGIRLLPDGRPLEIIVETAGEDSEQVDVLQLVASTWIKVGIKLFTKPLQREVFRNRIYSGETVMSVWGGLENGLPTPDMSPYELAPTRQDELEWPMWGQYFETHGAVGEKPDMAPAEELVKLYEEWRNSTDTAQRVRIWHRMLEIRSEQEFTIGIVAGVPQPVVVNDRLHNVPTEGVYNWDPGAYFGIYRPDTFWFAAK